ncbi:hypothetical protein N627_2109 [Levilactobacillus brevis]|nr:hypothetical protein N627_2109 [Levilactobacillus brevis]
MRLHDFILPELSFFFFFVHLIFFYIWQIANLIRIFGQICQHNLIRCLPVEYFKRSLVNLE